MQEFFQQIINGLSVGAVYALIAVGYTMVYGVLRFINFAHGDVFMLGAMVALLAATTWFGLAQYNAWLALPLVLLFAMILCGLFGFLVERFCYRPLRDQPRLTVLITAIGVSMLLEFGGQHRWLFGPTPQAFPRMLGYKSLVLGGVAIDVVDILIFALTIGLMIALSYIVKFTRTGMALRAVSFRFDTAMLMGINTDRIISFTFVLGSVLAAVGGVMYGIKYRQVDPLMGLMPGLKAFIAAVLGGIGNITGAVLGGFIIGFIENFASALGYSRWSQFLVFMVLTFVLIFRPSGLFGQKLGDRA